MKQKRTLLLICLTLIYTLFHLSGPGQAAAGERRVMSTADSGPGTFREALNQASSGDRISFHPQVFPPHQPATISLSTRLPTITQEALIIDASDAGVIVDGSAIDVEMAPGLDIRANKVAVRGLQIVRFDGCGVELRGNSNTIGGDRHVGAGPLGQGNLLSGNRICGIGMWGSATSHNTIRGNLIGVDGTGLQAWGNSHDGIHINGASYNTIEENVIGANSAAIQGCCNTDSSYNTIRNNLIGVGIDGQTPIPNTIFGVWLHDGASFNIVGPGNTIAYNPFAVQIDPATSAGNTITRNSIHNNVEGGIRLQDGGNGNLAAPTIMSFNLAAGTVWGETCGGCRVEIFSDQDDQGEKYEGVSTANAAGLFRYQHGAPLAGPHLTATATDAGSNTSPFSLSTNGSGVEWILQTDNYRLITSLKARQSQDLLDNRIGSGAGALWTLGDLYAWFDGEIASSGVKRFKVSISEGEEPIDWSRSELTIDPYYDGWITYLADQGMIMTYMLNFWDKANHPSGWTGITSRFKTAEEVQRFQEFVRFIVPHFCSRVPYFEIWGEPDNAVSPVQYIEPQEYIAVTKAVIPIIRSTCPGAKIVVGSTSYLRNAGSYNYMLEVVRSDLMPLIDIVAWHSMFGSSPAHPEHAAYYTAYPSIARQIKEEAIAHGFKGEFRGDEIVWRSPDCPWCATTEPLDTDITAAKYYARGIVINLGLDLDVHPTGNSSLRKETFAVVRNMSTIFAGARPDQITVDVDSSISDVAGYTFALPQDSYLIALWNDGIAGEEDPGSESTLTLPGFAGYTAFGIDPLHGLVQPLTSSDVGQNLIIRKLRIKDYPMFVRLAPIQKVYFPLVSK